MSYVGFGSSARTALSFWYGRLFGGLLRGFALGLAATGLAACVASDKPLVSDAKPTMGQQFTAKLFRNFSNGKAHELKAATYRWENGAYVNVGGAVDLRRFVSTPIEGDDEVLQGSDAGGKIFTYWLSHKLAEGTYLIIPLDERDVKPAGRTALCASGELEGFCFVDTKEHLVALARATARSAVKDAALAVIVGNGLKPETDILDVRR